MSGDHADTAEGSEDEGGPGRAGPHRSPRRGPGKIESRDRVAPFFATHEIPLTRILTDRGAEYGDAPDRHEYDLYLAVEDIEHTGVARRPGHVDPGGQRTASASRAVVLWEDADADGSRYCVSGEGEDARGMNTESRGLTVCQMKS